MMGINGTNDDTRELWKMIPQGSIGAEIGVWKGQSSQRFIRRAKHLHMVDPWSISAYNQSTDWLGIGYEGIKERYEYMVGSTKDEDYEKYYDSIYKGVCDKFKDKPVTIHRMTSTEFFNSYSGEKLDWIYLDGEHSYESVYKDLNDCLKVMKEKGVIYIDDMNKDNKQHPGVRQAAFRFAKEQNLKVIRILNNQAMIQL